jgi:Xaa-Pro aminopeptidase
MQLDEPDRGFAQSEFEARLEKAQKKLIDRGLEGLLLMTEPEVRYFSGFLTLFWQSPTRPWFLFVPSQGKPVAIIPEIGAALMQRTWLDDIRTWPAPRPHDDGISLLVDLLSSISTNTRRIGLMKGHESMLRMPLGDLEQLQTRLPKIHFEDATDLVRDLRMVKSEAEIEKTAYICGCASRTFAQANTLFHSGQPLRTAFREFKIACMQNGADDVPYLVGGAGPGGYDDIISPPATRALRDGDILMLDTGSVFDGYFCDFDRNFAIKTADEASQNAYRVLYEATQAGLAAARPGTTCRELFQAMRAVTARVDPSGGDVGRMGHGLGMQLTEWPSNAGFDNTVLEAGMVITLEPSLKYAEGLTMVHEENIVVRNGPPQMLSTRAPAELPIIG